MISRSEKVMEINKILKSHGNFHNEYEVMSCSKIFYWVKMAVCE